MQTENKKPYFLGFHRNIFILGIVSFLTDASTEMIYPILPVFLSVILGIGTVYIGVIEGIAESTASVLKVFSGYISDRFGKRKPLVVFGYSLSTIAKPFFALSGAGWHVLVIRFADRIGKGVRNAPRDAIIAESAPKESLGKSYGFHRAMDTAGAIVGPILAFIVLYFLKENYRAVFAFSFIPAFLAVVCIIIFVKEKKKPPSEEIDPPKINFSSFSREFKYLILVIVLFTLGNSSDAFLILRAKTIGIPVAVIPVLWMVFNTVYALAAMPFGMISDKIGRKKVILLGFFVYAIVYLGFAFASKPYHVWSLFIVYGLYYGLSEGTLRAYVADIISPTHRATAFGIYHTAVGITSFPASVVMGALWKYINIQTAFCFGAGMACMSGILLVALFRKKK
ncbi:MAG: MFS transporter [Planctomycetes bacterium]|nr:MFS transporter [Planctomycetota bacterium]